MSRPYRVAVIGGGPQGLVILKDLLELNKPDNQIFDVEVLEARDTIGGVWAASPDPNVLTALNTTIANVSKWRNCYSDFPVDEALGYEALPYLNQEQQLTYLEKFADSFDLRKHIHLGKSVTSAKRVDEREKWVLEVKDLNRGITEERQYDKVAVATGQFTRPNIPKISGLGDFRGTVIHSAAFKSPKDFQDKRVVIYGFGISAADTASDLVGHAKEVYLSHPRGKLYLSRIVDKRPLDVSSTQRFRAMIALIKRLSPTLLGWMFSKALARLAASSAKGRIKPEWGFGTTNSINFVRPMISDTILDDLESAAVKSIPGIRRVIGDDHIELEDGSVLGVDAIIFCTGYDRGSLLETFIDFEGTPRLPNLYYNIFPPAYADCLAFANCWFIGTGVCEIADLIGMAIGQVFAGTSKLPSKEQMNQQIAKHHSMVRAMAAREAVKPAPGAMERVVDEQPFRLFLHAMAKTRVDENLGYGWKGWRFWWTERRLCNKLMTGLDSPHLYRLFEPPVEAGRKAWPGARAAIEKANEQLEKFVKLSDEEQRKGLRPQKH